MSLGVKLAILMTFAGMTAGKVISTNTTSEMGGNNNNKLQMFVDIIFENMQSALDSEVHNTTSKAVKILDEMYRIKHLQTTERIVDRYTGKVVVNVPDKEVGRYTYETILKVESLKIKEGKYYYKKADSPSTLYTLGATQGEPPTIPEDSFHIPSFFDTITIKYHEARPLKIGNIEIQNDLSYTKYRVAHHLLEKLFFIGFDDVDDKYGALYAVDLRAVSSNTAIAEQILQSSSKSKFKTEFIDVAVDQYTGNLLIASKNRIFTLEKMLYSSDLYRFASIPDETKLIDG